ncbi:ATP-dependent RNA helicase HrpA [Luteimonas sp. MC1895]|uniref:ATP-dependent RNA helicase HrpA n=1 Tax=Luteimonas sp. MC1895 TaxID=2819513 RepID=UPI0018F080DA|nr:ATP-dependent RNA helicase HrpA [Luteimonas sp. MC1895]MBJ6980158.1 ATP-dependent RNA helicase HrpA [Luteimonas sp. MC1895]
MNELESSPLNASPASRRERRRAIDDALTRDRGRLLGLWRRWDQAKDDALRQAAFEDALSRSLAQREARAQRLPRAEVDPALPIATEAGRIVELLRAHQVVVVAGETGSGKTTQLPKLCLAAGRGAAGLIGCTQPRRIAARAVARRVAEELQVPLGGAVGYQVRFSENVGEQTAIKFMTDGILLAEIQSDRWLSRYDTLIIDEAHERSLNIDFLLGYLKQLLARRPNLKLVVTSATIDTARFSAHFNDAPVVNVEGRGYPVEVRYRPLDGSAGGDGNGDDGALSTTDGIVAACDEIILGRGILGGGSLRGGSGMGGDVLVFLPGEREIRDAHRALEGRKYRHTEVLPLYARLSVRDQDRVFNPGSQRRIVLATNVAETSLTVPRIHYVVDPGLARVKRYSPRQKLDRLHIEPISQASANQRAGRCGRIAPGVCYRLYDEPDFAARPEFTDPEIRRAALAGVILRMLSLGLGAIEEFPFLEPPDARAIADGWQQLAELGAVDAARRLTAHGEAMAKLPVDVKLARMLVAARDHRCLREMLVIASFLGIQDPRERPADQRGAADAAHAAFRDPKSEFVAILRLWEAYRVAHQDLTQSQLRKWCERNFLGFLRMREWRELHRQLKLQCEGLGWSEEDRAGDVLFAASGDDAPAQAAVGAPSVQDAPAPRRRRRGGRGQGQGQGQGHRDGVPASPDKGAAAQARDLYQSVHRALLAGLPTQVGHVLPERDKRRQASYEGPRGRRFQLFPGSTLGSRPPPWLLTATLLDTEKVWALTNAAIEPEWVEAELPHLLSRRHFDPRWSRKQGRVVGSEQVGLFGLVLAAARPFHYGAHYPEEARELFLRDGLVAGEINLRADVVARNRRTLESAEEEEAKQRRTGLVVDEDWMLRWYRDRIPAEITSAQALDAWYAGLPKEQRRALQWTRDDLLVADGSDAERFPAYFPLGHARLALHYRFEPGAPDDGMTVVVPLHLLNAMDGPRLGWLAPGFVQEKATALLRGLPKALRRNFVPAPDFARAFAEAHGTAEAATDSITGTLARFLKRMTGVELAATDFDESTLEPHLVANLRLLDADGRNVLAESRALDALRARFGARASEAFAAHAAAGLAREALTAFPGTAIPVSVPGAGGVPAFPALQDDGGSVSLDVHADRAEAERLHPGGVRRLLAIALSDRIRHARRQLPVQPKTALLYAAIESTAPREAGGSRPADTLREDLVDGAFAALTADGLADVRDPAAFAALVDAVGKALFPEAMRRLQQAEGILAQVAEVRAALEGRLMGWARGNLDDLQAQLAALVPAGFLRDVPADVLASYPRYLKAMAVRAGRALNDPSRDQQRMLELKPFADALARARADGRAEEPGWQALRWELEELRVQLFAQELGAKGGVSPKKLAARLSALT